MSDNEFEAWLIKNKNLKESSIKNYIGAVRTISKDLGKELGIDLKIYDISDNNEFNKIYKLYYDNTELMNKNKKGNSMYSNGLNCYKEFLQYKQNINNIDVKLDDEIAKEEKSLCINYKDVNKQIQKYINSKGFIYNDRDLSNFHLSLKTKPFVILAGVSGTGKSKLVKLFAEAIGASSKNGQYNIISVKPDWNDSTELFGYKNINDEFVPGQLTEIISTAYKKENMNKPYFVCLDEMNLARVEYYLSEYLSIIESREFKYENIETDKLFSEKYLNKDSEYYGLIIPENLYIIGTVNMDDTTFSFSKKVLDRANTIEFSEVNLENLDFGQGKCEAINLKNVYLKTSFINIKEALVTDKNFVVEINKKIIEINNILKKGNKNFGYRVRDEIVFYMLENKIAELLDEDTAFDYQIMQKILPAISGSESSIKDILIDLFNMCVTEDEVLGTGNYIKDCEAIIRLDKDNKESKVVRYKKSADKILMMLRGYEDGFTSFWA